MKNILLAIIVIGSFVSCNQTPEISPDMMDGMVIYDPSVYAPQDYLQSYANPNPSPLEAEKPVFIAIHGYSASTFEWNEFREWSNMNPDYYISQVLLGGHGLTYEDFKDATWKDWQKSIIDEYERLINAGYVNINFVGSSTSCTLIIDLLATGYFAGKTIPKNILLIDPIIISSSKSLSLIGILGPVLGYIEADNTVEEDKYWYHFRPQETLKQLQKVLNVVRKQLEKGIVLPEGCSLKVYKSIKDPTADPVSAVLIYNGMRMSGGRNIDIEMIQSDLHVFTRLNLRNNITSNDVENQMSAFTDFVTRVVK